MFSDGSQEILHRLSATSSMAQDCTKQSTCRKFMQAVVVWLSAKQNAVNMPTSHAWGLIRTFCIQGIGIDELLEAIVERIPPPAETRDNQLRALIFDSYYDSYKVSGMVLAAVAMP